MILFAMLSLLPPFLLAFQLIALLCPSWTHPGVRLSLAVGLAIGISSVSLFAGLTLLGSANSVFLATETGILLTLAAFLRLMRRKKIRTNHTPPITDSILVSQTPRSLSRACIIVLVSALTIIMMLLLRDPHGAWDGWAIWNMRARFLFRGGAHWADAFSHHLAWSHIDYPLLLPASIARVWYYVGKDSVFVPGAIAILFTLATITLLSSTLLMLRGSSQACLAILALLGTDYFLRHAAYLYADTPLSFFMLATTILFFLHGHSTEKRTTLLFLAGIMAGFAAWTKNEGLLFVFVVASVHLACHIRRRSWRQCLFANTSLLLGLLPTLGVVAYFKFHIASENELISALSSQSIADRMTDPSRYVLVARFFGRQIVSYGRGLVLVLVTYGIFMGTTRNRRHDGMMKMFIIVLSLMLCSYLAVYILTPHDLQWHLNTSAKRLLLQLLPMSLFLFFMVVATPEEAQTRRKQHD